MSTHHPHHHTNELLLAVSDVLKGNHPHLQELHEKAHAEHHAHVAAHSPTEAELTAEAAAALAAGRGV